MSTLEGFIDVEKVAWGKRDGGQCDEDDGPLPTGVGV